MDRSGAIVDRLLRVRHPLATSLIIAFTVGAIPLAGAMMLKGEPPVIAAPAGYLAFHNVVEFFSVMVALSIFGVGWYTYDLSHDRHALFLACAFLAIGIVDFAHTLSYPGMPPFVTPSSANKASTLWVGARFLSAVVFLASAFVTPATGPRWLRRPVLGIGALVVAAAVVGAVLFFPGRLPAAYVPGVGQTTFKRVAEYVIIALLAGAIAAHAARYARTREPSAVLYVAAFALSGLSELCFATYVSVADWWNALGHVYKVAAFYLVYRGVFIASVRRPRARLLETTGALEQEMARGAAARTALARLAAELAQERDRVSAIMEASPVAMTRLDRDGRILYANAAAERILGIRRQEITSRQFDAPEWRVSDPAGAPLPSSELPFAVVARTLAPARMRHAIERPEGRRVLVEVFGAPLLDAAGAFDGAVLAFEDVTERSQLEEQFRQAQKMEAVGRLAGGVAHDFNNLLTAILGTSDYLLQALPDGSAVREGAGEIRLAAERATALTRRLLTFSRKQVVVPRVIALDELVTGLLPMLQRLIGDDVELVARAGSRGRVRADPGQVEQVIMNLVVNARDAMPEGGRIALMTEDVDVGPEEAREQLGVRPGPFVALTASDTGIGMDAEVLSHLFEPFYTTKEPGKGTGLGLSTVYGIVKQAGGHVRVESTKGAGTVFRIYLPRVEASGDEQVPCGATAAGMAPPAAVLLVEDEPQVRSVILRALNRAGHHVTEAVDVEDALQRAADLAQPIELLITDVVMPRLGGRELASRIRTLRPGLKVLFVSGYLEQSFPLDELSEDTGFLQKPFGSGALAEAVGALLVPPRACAAVRR